MSGGDPWGRAKNTVSFFVNAADQAFGQALSRVVIDKKSSSEDVDWERRRFAAIEALEASLLEASYSSDL